MVTTYRSVTEASPMPDAEPQRATRGAGRFSAVIALIAALLTAFLTVAVIGAQQAAHGQRVLSLLDPLVGWIRGPGKAAYEWLLAKPIDIGQLTTAAAAAVALVGLIVGRRAALPLVLLAAAVALAAWGQILLLADRLPLGIALYVGGVVCAVALGIWCPMARLRGFPELPVPEASPQPERRAARLPFGWECVLVFLLTVIALLSRTYALTELPSFFEGEMTISFLSSRTLAGLRTYVPWALTANSTGLAHLLPQLLSYELFGTSIYALRLVAVFFGVVTVPLFYWLVRRLAGIGPALAGTVLFIAAPEQLWWSRAENSYFILICFLAVVTAHLGLWMVRRFSFPAVLTAALWMPFSRYFYAPGMVLVLYPTLLYAHGVCCVRGAWRKAWYVVPLLAAGTVMWLFSLSAVDAYMHGTSLRFVNPMMNGGVPVWRKQGEFASVSVPELIRLQVVSTTRNLGQVAEGLAYSGGFSQWYQRANPSSHHPTIVNVGVVVMLALGLGYLLGQVWDRRAFMLLLWVGLGLLPGVLSTDPAARRILLIFPALYAIVAVLLGAIVRLVRTAAGGVAAWLTTVPLSAAVAAVAATSLASHLLLPINPTAITSTFRFTKPVFEQSDTIFHNVGSSMALLLAYGNLDRFLEDGTPCYQAVSRREWLDIALHPHCEFTGEVYQFSLPPERIAALRAGFKPQRISFLLTGEPHSRAHLDLLRGLFPRARLHTHQIASGEIKLVALSVDIADVEALSSPLLKVGSQVAASADLESGLLAGVRLTPATARNGDAPGSQEIVVEGGLLVSRDGWYRYELAPACPEATWWIDNEVISATAAPRPMLAGAHALKIALTGPITCQLPLQLRVQAGDGHGMVPVAPDRFVAASVAALPQAQAPPFVPYPGYGPAQRFAQMPGTIIDFAVDGAGSADLLVRETSGFRVHRLNPRGDEEAVWQVEAPNGRNLSAIAVAPAGEALLRADRLVLPYDREGRPLGQWNDPQVWTLEIALLRDGRVLSCLPDRNSIGVLGPDGALQQQWNHFAGGPGRFDAPVSVTINEAGDLLVIQTDGQALLFHTPPEQFAPVFVNQFQIDFSRFPVMPRGCTFDGPDRIVVADPDAARTLVYNFRGERMLAEEQARDLSAKGFTGEVVRLQSANGRLYVLDAARTLWSLPH
jgi:hypothetical protein